MPNQHTIPQTTQPGKVACTCGWCGADFLRYRSEIDKAVRQGSAGTFCSRSCYVAHRSRDNEQRTCETCGRQFTVWASTIKHSANNGWNAGRYCSVACADAGNYRKREQKFDVQCLWCGNHLRRPANRLRRGNYCDTDCFMRHRHQKALDRCAKPCIICGVMLELREGEKVPNYAKRLTCSADCRKAQIVRTRLLGRERATPYPTEWTKALRTSIRARDGFACQECGALEDGRFHDVHHIDYNQQNCDPSNLITLCMSCHRKTTNPGNQGEWVARYQSVMQERRMRPA